MGDGLPLVLKDVSFTIADGEKIGIVGRTGSGKSSILVSIFRMVEGSSGSILLNGVDTGFIPKHQDELVAPNQPATEDPRKNIVRNAAKKAAKKKALANAAG